MSVNEILKKRGKEYGDHTVIYDRVWKLWGPMIEDKEFHGLKGWQKVEVMMILFKVGRGVSSPDVDDHWDDIGGYAQLVKGNDPSVHNHVYARFNHPTGFQCGLCKFVKTAESVCQQSEHGLICKKCADKFTQKEKL